MFKPFNAYLTEVGASEEPVNFEPIDAGNSEPEQAVDAPLDFPEALEETLRDYFGSDADGSAMEIAEPESEGEDGEDIDVIETEQDDIGTDEEEFVEGESGAIDETDDLDSLWDELLSSFTDAVHDDSEDSEEPVPAPRAKGKNEIDEMKRTLDTLVSWQSAVQQYLQTSVEAENVRQVAQQLASLGVILPDEQIQEIAQLSQQLNIPPSVLLKAKAYDYTVQKIQQDDTAPYPFMAPSQPPAPVGVLPTTRPFTPEQNDQPRVGFTSFRQFLNQLGVREE